MEGKVRKRQRQQHLILLQAKCRNRRLKNKEECPWHPCNLHNTIPLPWKLHEIVRIASRTRQHLFLLLCIALKIDCQLPTEHPQVLRDRHLGEMATALVECLERELDMWGEMVRTLFNM